MRLIERLDYWALILGDATPLISVDQRSVLSSLRRMKMGVPNMYICTQQTNDIINLASDESVSPIKKEKMLIDLFSMYELLPENHPFKNFYFACLIHVLLTLFFINKTGFILALRLLLRLLKDGSVTIETYREIVSQLIMGGVSKVDIDIV